MTDLDILEAVLKNLGGGAIAVSGGVDSMTLATVAGHIPNTNFEMFHALSPAVPAHATARVRDFAKREGWRLREIIAGEFDDPSYRANPVNRCFYCKTNLYGTVSAHTNKTVLSGTNTDDLSDYRPGLDAARDHDVCHPYVEAGISKAGVRAIARYLSLIDLADLPAAPCLSSRVETGLRIESNQLTFIDAVEKYVARHISAHTVRCRIRKNEVAIELDAGALQALEQATANHLRDVIENMMRTESIAKPLSFKLYRMGSAFLHKAVDG